MAQQDRSARVKRFSGPQIIPLGLSGRKSAVPLRLAQTVLVLPPGYSTAFKLLAILLLAPAIIALSALILVGLLVIFVIWLVIVAVMAVAIVSCDLVHIAMWRMRQPQSAVGHSALPAGQ
jgi:hypothetical protein